MKPLDQRSQAYVVRLWQERRDIDGAEPTWRGSIEDVEAGSRVYFECVDELCAVLVARSGMQRRRPARRPRQCPVRRREH